MITRVKIDGMTCQHCVRAVFTALGAVEGISSAEVSIGGASIEHDGMVTVERVRDAVAVAGYAVVDGETNRRSLPIA
jgi:copper chaperone CopZ